MMTSRPRLLVLGASGPLGLLLRANWPQAAQADVIWHGRRDGFDLRFDIQREAAALAEAMADADRILVLAGATPASGRDMRLNPDLLAQILRFHDDQPLFYASSAAVYGDQPGALDETAPPEPRSAYARAKCAAEALLQGRRACALRIGNVIGADTLFAQPQAHYEIDQFPDGQTPRRSYIGPASLARVLDGLFCIATPAACLNLAASPPVTLAELVEQAGATWSAKSPGAEAIKSVHLDVTRLQTLLPEIDLTTTAAAMLAEHKAPEPAP